MIIVSGRRGGKTYKLVQWVKKGNKVTYHPFWNRVILAMSVSEADRLRKEYDLDYHQVFSVNEWRNRHIGYRVGTVEVAIDNADMILASIVGSYVLSTHTDEVEILHG